jgi:hypothetical protein
LLHDLQRNLVEEEEKSDVTNHQDGIAAGLACMRRLRGYNQRSWADHGTELATEHVGSQLDGANDADHGEQR